MKTFLEYCFYKSSKFYKRWGESNYHISGKFALFLALCSNILTLLSIFCAILGTRYKTGIIYLLCSVFGVLSFFGLDKKKYKELERRYRSERNSKLKGWLVFAYISVSFVLYFISLYLMPLV